MVETRDVLTWHVFYRTMGMTNRNEKGWARAQFTALSPDDALAQLMRNKHNILHARVYPGATCYMVEVKWTPDVHMKHEPHSV